jgi:hypothetical protein
MATSTDLRAAIEEVQKQLPELQVAAPDQLDLPGADWASRLERRVGALPWWAISAAVHAVIFLLATLLTVALPPAQVDEVVISTDVAKQEEKTYDEKLKRDIFKQTAEIRHETEVEKPVLVHEETEVSDHFETDNDMDANTARGHEDSISDIPLGGTGVTGSVGVGGGGMAGVFGYRGGGGRKRAVARFGGSPATESAVEAALRWLARHQEADGHWDIKKYEGGGNVHGGLANDSAVTGMAMLAFLGAGHTHKQGKYRDNVRRAAEWIIKTQRPDGGWTDHAYKAYALGLNTLALAEAYGMTKDPRMRLPAQKGVDRIFATQDRYAAWHHGGLRSTSVTGWMVMALKSARIAGLKVDGGGFQGATNWLNKVTDADSGKVGYSGPGRYPFSRGLAMTSVGMVCRQFMGTPRTEPLMIRQANLLLTDLPNWEAENTPSRSAQHPYHWYYGTLAMFQMGGDHWRKWNTALKKTLLPNQRKGGDEDGSWDCRMGWGPTGGRVYTTAINALSLEVYYRYLPMYAK